MASPNVDLFDSYFRRADLDGDGRISGAEAVGFFQGANLPKTVLAQIWMFADQNKAGYLGRTEFYNALKLVTVAQSKRELTPEIVKAALYSPASAKIPAPQINLAATPSPQLNSRAAAPVPHSAATPSPQLNPRAASSVPHSVAPSPQHVGPRAPHVPVNAGINQQYFPSQQNQTMRPSQNVPTGHVPHPQQHIVASQGMPGAVNAVRPRPPNSNVSADWLHGRAGNQLVGVNSQVPNSGISPSTAQNGFGLTASTLPPSVQPGQTSTGQMPTFAPNSHDSSQSANKDSKALVVSGNGTDSDSLFGDVFSATQSLPKQDGLAVTAPAGSAPAAVPASARPQPSVKANTLDALYNRSTPQPVGVQSQQGQARGKQDQQFSSQSIPASASSGFPVGAVNSASSQSEPPWPKMTQSAVQKYTKVFLEVDKDRDGKITGEEARNLFLSWRLPREILKQVWDLSDQDNDSMLSLREFCIALYLMERFREGRPLPAVLPRSIMLDETMLSITGQPTAPHGNASWGPTSGFQQTQNASVARSSIPGAVVKPPRPPSVPQADKPMQPTQQKPRVPELEKHLLNQLSSEEQDSLNKKFQDATNADKKVEELEKEIMQAREKIDFFRSKMQEIILYKSRCDNRLNEIIERVSADKHEAESLAKKYEQKCTQVGDVASKLTSEEATFRDIQEKKMELYQAIVKMEGSGTEDDLKARAEKIQSGLDELVKSVNKRCKKYGLRTKPSSLVELPFGWQPGIQENSADWDENWDKFEEEEGFTFVKELTLDVQNVIAPPKPKFSTVKREITSGDDDGLTPSDTVAKSESEPETGKQTHENESNHEESNSGLTRSPPDSPSSRSAVESQSQEFQEVQAKKSVDPDGNDTHSDHNGFGDKSFDESGWGKFDTHYDTDSVWGNDSVNDKEMDHERRDNSIFDTTGDFGLKPLRIEPPHTDSMFPGKSSSIFADSVPSTPAYNFGNSPQKFSSGFEGKGSFGFADSVPSTPAYNFGSSTYKFSDGFEGKSSSSAFADSVPSTPAYNFGSSTHNPSLFADSVPSTPAYNFGSTTQSSSIFADSVPSTPAYNFGNSTQRFGEGSEDHSFDHFSRYDSFNTRDSGAFQHSPRNSLGGFDSMNSSRDFDISHNYSSASPRSLARFDSVRSSADFDPSHGFSSSPRSSYARFDSVKGSGDFDPNHGFSSSSPRDSFARFDSFRSSKDFDHNHGFSSFDDSDPFGSTGPFKTSVESQPPKRGSDNWSAF